MRVSQPLKHTLATIRCIVIVAIVGCSGSKSDNSTEPYQPVYVEPFSMWNQGVPNQTVDVGTRVDFDPAVVIADANSTPVTGITVTFRITAGGGFLNGVPSTTSFSTVTAAGSISRVSWTVGPSPGLNTLIVTAEKVRDTLTFSAIGATPLPFMQSLVKITAGWDHTCGIAVDGRAYCWGSNSKGQLGTNTPKDSAITTPMEVAGGLRFSDLSAGNFHTCGATTDKAYCWGYNEWGQLGDGTRTDRPTPVAVIGPHFVTISAGGGRTNFADVAHSCALTPFGVAYCWGYNGYGEAGTGVAGNIWLQPEPVSGGITFRGLSAGGFHTCGVAYSREAYCWGDGTSGQLGLGLIAVTQAAPARVPGDYQFDELSAGSSSTCGWTASAFYCWGADGAGQLGDGIAIAQRLAPTPVAGSMFFMNAALGFLHTCARTADGVAYCWGWNLDGQLGIGPRRNEFERSPVPVATDVRFNRMAAGSAHACGIAAVGAAYCWGTNDYGELGDGTRISRSAPVRVRSR